MSVTPADTCHGVVGSAPVLLRYTCLTSYRTSDHDHVCSRQPCLLVLLACSLDGHAPEALLHRCNQYKHWCRQSLLNIDAGGALALRHLSNMLAVTQWPVTASNLDLLVVSSQGR